MAFHFAAFVPVDLVSAAPMEHEWDDWDPYPLLGKSDEDSMNALQRLTDRAIIAFSIACAEWVVARFVRISNDEHPMRFIEACWAFEMDIHYAAPQPNQDEDWKGPIRGPLDMAMVTILNTYYTTEEGVAEIEGAFNERVARHVLVGHEAFDSWRAKALQRLSSLYPRVAENRWGDPVPREALDPNVPLESVQRDDYVRAFLASLDAETNPLIRRTAADNSR